MITTNKVLKVARKIMTSPSERRFRNYYSLFKPYGIQYSKKKPDSSETIIKRHHSRTSLALLNKNPLLRWLTTIFIVPPKDRSRPKKISKLDEKI